MNRSMNPLVVPTSTMGMGGGVGAREDSLGAAWEVEGAVVEVAGRGALGPKSTPPPLAGQRSGTSPAGGRSIFTLLLPCDLIVK